MARVSGKFSRTQITLPVTAVHTKAALAQRGQLRITGAEAHENLLHPAWCSRMPMS